MARQSGLALGSSKWTRHRREFERARRFARLADNKAPLVGKLRRSRHRWLLSVHEPIAHGQTRQVAFLRSNLALLRSHAGVAPLMSCTAGLRDDWCNQRASKRKEIAR